MPETVSVREWERQVFDHEGVRVVVRAAPSEQVAAYKPLSPQSSKDLFVERFVQAHLRPQLEGKSVEVISPFTWSPIFGQVPLHSIRTPSRRRR